LQQEHQTPYNERPFLLLINRYYEDEAHHKISEVNLSRPEATEEELFTEETSLLSSIPLLSSPFTHYLIHNPID
jgi:hypothetical protein